MKSNLILTHILFHNHSLNYYIFIPKIYSIA